MMPTLLNKHKRKITIMVLVILFIVGTNYLNKAIDKDVTGNHHNLYIKQFRISNAVTWTDNGIHYMKVFYSATIINEGLEDIFIKAFEPIPRDEITTNVVTEILKKTINEIIPASQGLEISGEFVIKLNELLNRDIDDFLPFFSDIKVSLLNEFMLEVPYVYPK